MTEPTTTGVLPGTQQPQDKLRERAEQEIALGEVKEALQRPPTVLIDNLRALLHELQVHKIELELQNEELRRVKNEVEISRARYFELYDLAPVGYCVVSETGSVLEANLTLATLLGVTHALLVQQPLSRYIAPQDQDLYYQMRQKLLAEASAGTHFGSPVSLEIRMLKGSGEQIWVLVTAIAAAIQEESTGGKAMQLRLTLSDITKRKDADAKIQLAASVFTYAREGIVVADSNGIIIEVNDAFTRITGYSRDEAIGKNPSFLSSGRQDPTFYADMWRSLAQHGHWSGELWNRHKSGSIYAELLTIGTVVNEQGIIQQYAGLFSDITAIKEHQAQMEQIAHFDSLTHLPNRVLLMDRLAQGLAQAARRGNILAVAYLDLDGFKSINDCYGHGVGDQLLIALAANMKDSLREGDTLARMGGDEFVAVLTDFTDSQDCLPLLMRLIGAAAQKVTIGEVELQVAASLGVTFFPQSQAIESEQLLRQADLAMYHAKLMGGNRYHVFDAAHDSDMRVHHEDLQQIQWALERHEFKLYYQPKVNMRTGKILGFEALIRWQHPEKGLMTPETFLPVVEEHPLYVSIGEWVIDAALDQIEQWHTVGMFLPVSINIGARQLQQTDFVERLQANLAKHPKLSPSCLELEILETNAISDMVQVSRVIDDCERIGIPSALDDFGTGYSSLTYLKRLHAATLKIDQSFVRDMLQDPDDQAILQGVIGLANAFKRVVIAEGVETIAHGTALLNLGCELAQGYCIAHPMPGDAVPAWAACWRPDAAWSTPLST